MCSRIIRRSLGLGLWIASATLLFCVWPAFGELQKGSAGTHFPNKKILWVDSYHPSYEWSAGIERGIREKLQESGVELQIVRMDSKRRSSESEKRRAAWRAKEAIETFNPDVVIASDDNASKYLVAPYLKDTDLPVVFCGVNWDASVYGFPARNVTGMVEVALIDALNVHLKRYTKGSRVGYLSGKAFTAQKIASHYNDHYYAGRMKLYLVKDFAGFKEAFLRAQDEVDMLFINNYVGIGDWNPEAAKQFLVEHVRIPTVSQSVFMAPFVLLALAKDPQEQGEWAASTALEILGGRTPSEIPLAYNERALLFANLKMADALGITFPLKTLEAATVIGQESFAVKP